MQIHLNTPVEITVNGQIESSEFLNITDPNMFNLGNIAILSEIGSKALLAGGQFLGEQSKKKEEHVEKDEDMDAETAIILLKMGGQYVNAINEFKIFLTKFGMFDDTKVQTGSLERMDISDFLNALGTYFAKYCFLENTRT